MKREIFKTPRRGWLGQAPQGAEYMQDVNKRAKRMKAALRDPDQAADSRQQHLPGFIENRKMDFIMMIDQAGSDKPNDVHKR